MTKTYAELEHLVAIDYTDVTLTHVERNALYNVILDALQERDARNIGLLTAADKAAIDADARAKGYVNHADRVACAERDDLQRRRLMLERSKPEYYSRLARANARYAVMTWERLPKSAYSKTLETKKATIERQRRHIERAADSARDAAVLCWWAE